MSLFEEASLVVTPNGTKASKLYAIKPTDGSGDLTVTRATTATRVNSAGLIESVAVNVPRLDYTNSTCPSILVEPQRTNNFLYSEQFDNVFWVKSAATVIANDAVSPSGIQNADRVSFNSGLINPTVTIVGNSTYTISFFAKKGTANTLRIAEAYWAGTYVDFDLNAGTVTSGTGKIENYGNGWYRCSMQFTYGLGQNIAGWVIRNYESGYIYLWGGSLEQGSYATSYIPTTSASVTRNADVISKTGISDLIGQTEGTMFFDLKSVANNEFKRLSINGGSYVNSILFDFDNSNNLYAKVFNGGSAVVTLLASGVNIANRNKIAFAYKNNDFSFYVNGLQVGSQTSGAVPSGLDRLDFSLAGSELFEGTINSGAIFKTRLTNAELAELTTL